MSYGPIILWFAICRRCRNLTRKKEHLRMYFLMRRLEVCISRKTGKNMKNGIWKAMPNPWWRGLAYTISMNRWDICPADSGNDWLLLQCSLLRVMYCFWMSRRTIWMPKWQSGWKIIWKITGEQWLWWHMTGIFWTVYATGLWKSIKDRFTAMRQTIPDILRPNRRGKTLPGQANGKDSPFCARKSNGCSAG